MATILVVDDELGIRIHLEEVLSEQGHHVETAANASEAREMRAEFGPELILLDIWMPDCDGISLLKEWTMHGLDVPVIMMGGHGALDAAVEAKAIGAQSFLEKPFTQKALLAEVNKSIEQANPKVAVNNHIVNGVYVPVITTERIMRNTLSDVVTCLPEGLYMRPIEYQEAPKPEPTAEEIRAEEEKQRRIKEILDRPFREALQLFEKAYFSHHLERNKGSMTLVSHTTKIERTHLYRKLKNLGVDMKIGKKPKEEVVPENDMSDIISESSDSEFTESQSIGLTA